MLQQNPQGTIGLHGLFIGLIDQPIKVFILISFSRQF